MSSSVIYEFSGNKVPGFSLILSDFHSHTGLDLHRIKSEYVSFRCSCVFEILLRVLAAYISASRVWLLEHSHKLNCMSQASSDPSGNPLETSSIEEQVIIFIILVVYHLSSQEREELRVALTAAQESGIIQLLLEICLPNDKDREVSEG